MQVLSSSALPKQRAHRSPGFVRFRFWGRRAGPGPGTLHVSAPAAAGLGTMRRSEGGTVPCFVPFSQAVHLGAGLALCLWPSRDGVRLPSLHHSLQRGFRAEFFSEVLQSAPRPQDLGGPGSKVRRVQKAKQKELILEAFTCLFKSNLARKSPCTPLLPGKGELGMTQTYLESGEKWTPASAPDGCVPCEYRIRLQFHSARGRGVCVTCKSTCIPQV